MPLMMLTPRQRRTSRLMWPEFDPKPAGPHAKTKTLRQQSLPKPPWIKALMSPERAQSLLRHRRRVERQNRRRGRQQRRR